MKIANCWTNCFYNIMMFHFGTKGIGSVRKDAKELIISAIVWPQCRLFRVITAITTIEINNNFRVRLRLFDPTGFDRTERQADQRAAGPKWADCDKKRLSKTFERDVIFYNVECCCRDAPILSKNGNYKGIKTEIVIFNHKIGTRKQKKNSKFFLINIFFKKNFSFFKKIHY